MSFIDFFFFFSLLDFITRVVDFNYSLVMKMPQFGGAAAAGDSPLPQITPVSD